MFPLIKCKKKFDRLIEISHILSYYDIVCFLRTRENHDSSLLLIKNGCLKKVGPNFSLASNKYLRAFKGRFCIIAASHKELSKVLQIINKYNIFAISYKKHFINNIFFEKLSCFNEYFKYNYWNIISYSVWSLVVFQKFLYKLLFSLFSVLTRLIQIYYFFYVTIVPQISKNKCAH